jgi:hypothetical protein
MTHSIRIEQRKRAGIHLALMIVAVFAPCVAMRAAEPVVTLEAQAVIVTGLTPDKKFLLFGIGQEGRYPPRISAKADLLSADADGAFRLDVSKPLPAMSLWVAADLQTGDCAVAAPSGFHLKQSVLPAGALRARGNGVSARLHTEDENQELLYVRPGLGAWQLSGGYVLQLAAMLPVGDSPAPPEDFAVGDLFVTINPYTLVVRTFRVR